MKYYLLCVLVMFIVSFLPRVIPMVFFRKKVKNKFFKPFLYYMPYAVLAALTFPAVFFCTDSVPVAAIVTAVALILSFFRLNMALVAAIGVILAFGLGFLF